MARAVWTVCQILAACRESYVQIEGPTPAALGAANAAATNVTPHFAAPAASFELQKQHQILEDPLCFRPKVIHPLQQQDWRNGCA